ncbi:MAG: hypothetical protein ACRDPM_12355, partial [Solirubrobacteraceae bacterium]
MRTAVASLLIAFGLSLGISGTALAHPASTHTTAKHCRVIRGSRRCRRRSRTRRAPARAVVARSPRRPHKPKHKPTAHRPVTIPAP